MGTDTTGSVLPRMMARQGIAEHIEVMASTLQLVSLRFSEIIKIPF
jgi:hypothetical protein